MLATLDRIIVFVSDVRRAAAFYRDAFDLRPLPSDDPEGWQELLAGGCRLAFHRAHGPDGPVEEPTGGPMTPHKIVFFADDVGAVRDELIARGVEVGGMQTFGDHVLCDGEDPEGHRFQISSRP